MSAFRISELRQSGRLKEAYNLAEQMLKTDGMPDENVRLVKRNMGWVLFDYLKQSVESEQHENSIKTIERIMALELDESETVLFEQYAWKIGKAVFHSAGNIEKMEKMSGMSPEAQRMVRERKNGLQICFGFLKQYPPERPSKVASFLLKAFLKAWKKSPNFLDFADWWDFVNLREDDYKMEQMPDGKKVSSLAERMLIAYTSNLLNGTGNPQAPQLDKKRIDRFLPFLEEVTHRHPDFEFAVYSQSKLYLALNNKDAAFRAVLPFARNNQHNFWVWNYLGDLYPSDPEMQLACFCRALICKAPDKFLTKIRKKAAHLCIQQRKYAEAKHEIEQYVHVRNKHGWSIAHEVSDWQQSDWYATAETVKDNASFYRKQAQKAQNALAQDIPEKIILVTHVHPEKPILHFMKAKDEKGFLNYQGQLESPEPGDVLKVRLQNDENEEYHEMFGAVPATDADQTATDFIHAFSGNADIPEGKDFGFIRGKNTVFLPPDIIGKHGIKNGQQVSGRAGANFDKKKKRWGWSAVSVTLSLTD